MVVTRFVRRDGRPTEEYWYHNKTDAIFHADLFKDDDSGLYNSIDVVDDDSGVLYQLTF